MNINAYLHNVKGRYNFQEKSTGKDRETNELAFLAMLHWFFTEVHEKGIKLNFLSKTSLRILDVGCGTMPYAWPLKVFFEHFGTVREVSLLGIDTDAQKINQATKKIAKNEIEGVEAKHTDLHELRKGGYDIITCFHLGTSGGEPFFKKISALLNDNGIFLMSFFVDKFELDNNYRGSIDKSGFRIRYETENPFQADMHFLPPLHVYLCLATK